MWTCRASASLAIRYEGQAMRLPYNNRLSAKAIRPALAVRFAQALRSLVGGLNLMKKTLLIALVAAGAATVFSSSASAQDFVAPLHRIPQATTPPGAKRAVREGGLNRGVRMGNPAQMLNPFAPPEYGTGAEFVEYRENDPFLRPRSPEREHPLALRLLAFEF